MAAKNFGAFKKTIEREFMGHPVVTHNDYTAWFARGEVPLDHVRDFTVQFSVFSNQFLLAALNRVINADTLHAARESKEILMNELGVIYNKKGKAAGRHGQHTAIVLEFADALARRIEAIGAPVRRAPVDRDETFSPAHAFSHIAENRGRATSLQGFLFGPLG